MMRTTKISIMGYRLWVIGMLMLLCAVEVQAVTYDTYKSAYSQSAQRTPSMATAPQSGFQSTSAFSDQWATREGQPYINGDGTVNDGAYGIGRRPGLRKDPVAPPPNPDDPDENEDDGNTPIGDALLPLMLLAIGYWVVRKRNRTLEH